ncbi:S-methyl-5'-thioadenosine phosphorylase-like protein [Cricetulus griseus]|nr:S-methyl-5'-thioadenosine phosphorylase-like protein [Cricetulus griseus]
MASGAACTPVKIGIIGGTGLDDPEILEGRTEKYVDTPFGKPSDALILGKIKNVDCVLLARHGRQHTIMPSKVNYQANIWALKEEGCTHVLVTTACGSLREEIQPGDMVIIDQFIDRTSLRPQTFYDGSHCSARGVCHIPMAEPFCPKTREVLIETAKKLGLRCHSKGTIVTIEGPRFSSRAESFVFRTWGADVINMTTVPEVVLAKEAGICYASIAMATDYDCWKEHEEAVSVDGVLKTMKENANKAKSLLLTTIPQIGSMEWSETLRNLKVSGLTPVSRYKSGFSHIFPCFHFKFVIISTYCLPFRTWPSVLFYHQDINTAWLPQEDLQLLVFGGLCLNKKNGKDLYGLRAFAWKEEHVIRAQQCAPPRNRLLQNPEGKQYLQKYEGTSPKPCQSFLIN